MTGTGGADGSDAEPSSVAGAGSPAPPADPTDPTALEALHPLATSEVDVIDVSADRAGLRHREVYTMRGLLSVLAHEPPSGTAPTGSAIVACGGAMGGVLGPGRGLYHHLGERWAARGTPFLRVGYREPNNLDLCAHDLACGVEMARDAGADRVVVMGHSFGGAVAIRAAVVMPASVVGVVTFATQSAGCEVAAALGGRPLLLFHGDRDELLPPESSWIVQAMAGSGEVVVLPGEGHLLAESDDAITQRLDDWLAATLT